MKHCNWMADHATKVKQALIEDIKLAYKSGEIDIDTKVVQIASVKSLGYKEAIRACERMQIDIPRVNACY